MDRPSNPSGFDTIVQWIHFLASGVIPTNDPTAVLQNQRWSEEAIGAEMLNIELSRVDSEPLEAWLFRPAIRRATPSFQQRLEDRQFLEMEQVFRASGGIASGDELANRLRRCSEQPISMLARWIVERRAVSFPWRSQTLLPLFQFDLSTMTLRPSVIEVVFELKDVFDDWDLAMWFARPNAWLSDSAPVNLVDVDISAVLNAARADRFIALG